jgi:hypothetical protein
METEENLEAGGAPEVTEVAEAPPAEPAVEVEAETSDPSQSVASEPEVAAPASFPSADEFAWDGWDGNDEGLPEQLRPWSDRFRTYHSASADQRIKEATERAKKSDELFQAILGGNEDPRIKEFESKVGEWETKYNDLNTEFSGVRDQYDSYQKMINEAIDAEAKQYAEWFQSQNEDVFTDETRASIFAGLLDEGWELETAAVAARMSPEQIQTARKAKKDNVPDSYAIRLAADAKSVASGPRPGAKLIAGATTPVRSAEQTAAEPPRPSNLQDLRSSIAAKALKKHSNSRRR